ncbi:hypothetical protein BP6252_02231 [Coleophoma cylindrospora]|uniref:Ubiquitin-like protease family profile domain-containing protein n=1 Tax=Coleophoma cylindrospora TaxID=1849047 RepID=A0A3D8SEL9_9HELO|nr:hypothetical protein BP6252_02231 [Coleophoma cylindrospora]
MEQEMKPSFKQELHVVDTGTTALEQCNDGDESLLFSPRPIKIETPSPRARAKQLGPEMLRLQYHSQTDPEPLATRSWVMYDESQNHGESLDDIGCTQSGGVALRQGFQDTERESSTHRKEAQSGGVSKNGEQDHLCNHREQNPQNTREYTKEEPCEHATNDANHQSNQGNARKKHTRKPRKRAESLQEEAGTSIPASKPRRRSTRLAERASKEVYQTIAFPSLAPEHKKRQKCSDLSSVLRADEDVCDEEHKTLAQGQVQTRTLLLHAGPYLQQTKDKKAKGRNQKEIKKSNASNMEDARDGEQYIVQCPYQAAQQMAGSSGNTALANHKQSQVLASDDPCNSPRLSVVNPAGRHIDAQLGSEDSRIAHTRRGDEQWVLQKRVPPTSANSSHSGAIARGISAWGMAPSDLETINSHGRGPEQTHMAKHPHATSSPTVQNPEDRGSAESQEIEEVPPKRVQKSNIEPLVPLELNTKPLQAGTDAFSSENVRKEKRSSETKTTLLKDSPTSWGSNYWTQLGSSLPSYGGPQDSSAVAVPKPGNKMKNLLLSGPKPINTLKNDPHNQSIPAKPKKFFNLTGPSDLETPPSKRQKTGVVGHRNTESDVIDLEELEVSSSQRSREKRPSIHGKDSVSGTGSGRGSGTLDGRPTELQRLNEAVSFPSTRNKRRSNESQKKSNYAQVVEHMGSVKSDRLKNPTNRNSYDRGSYHLEDENDLISSTDDDNVLVAVHKKVKGTPLNNFDIEITPTSSHIGITDRAAAPRTPSLRTRIDEDLGHSDHISKYFGDGRSQGRRFKDSKSGPESYSKRTSSRTAHPDHNVHAKTFKMQKALHRHEDDSDVEMVDPKALANDLLQARSRRSSSCEAERPDDMLRTVSARGKASAQRALAAAHGSKQETPFPFKSSISQTNKATQIYEVKQLFSETNRWTTLNEKHPGQVQLEYEHRRMVFYGDEKQLILRVAIASIMKVQRAALSSKLCIQRHRESMTGAGTRLYLQLDNSGQVDRFLRNLIQIESKLDIREEEKPRLERIFQTQLKNSSPQSLKTLSAGRNHDIDELDDEGKGCATSESAGASKRTESVKAQRQKRMIDNLRLNDEEGTDELTTSPDDLHHPMRKMTGMNVVVEQKDRQLQPETFYGTSKGVKPPNSQPPGTRSSTRVANAESKARTPARQRSPSPEKWTSVNKDWKENWVSSIIYPPEGNKKATVDMQDIERLDDGEFLNDNLISFYLRWLEEHHLTRQRPDLAKRIYFHNTFFYTSLTKGKPGQRGINYEAVQRWTAKVDLFSYDYIIVPVNESTHWYVVIICNASKLLAPSPTVDADASNAAIHLEVNNHEAVAVGTEGTAKSALDREDQIAQDTTNTEAKPVVSRQTDIEMVEPPREDDVDLVSTTSKQPNAIHGHNSESKQTPTKKSKRKSTGAPRKFNPDEPKIIALDSLACPRSPTCINLKDYLVAEIKNKKGVDVSPPVKMGMTAKCLPQQTNFYDCGVFLLDYIEKFLHEPDAFIRKVILGERDPDIQWRTGPEMRAHIRETILDLQETQGVELKRKRALKTKRRLEKMSQATSSARLESPKTDSTGALVPKDQKNNTQQTTEDDMAADSSKPTIPLQNDILDKGKVRDSVDQQQPSKVGQRTAHGHSDAHTSNGVEISNEAANPGSITPEIPESPVANETPNDHRDEGSFSVTRSISPGDQLRLEGQRAKTASTPESQSSAPLGEATSSRPVVRQVTISPTASVRCNMSRARSSSLESVERSRFLVGPQADVDMLRSEVDTPDSLGKADDAEMLLSNREDSSAPAEPLQGKTSLNVTDDEIGDQRSRFGGMRDKEDSAEADNFYDLTVEKPTESWDVDEQRLSMSPMTPRKGRRESIYVVESRQVQTEPSSNPRHGSAVKSKPPTRAHPMSRTRDSADAAIVGRHLKEQG